MNKTEWNILLVEDDDDDAFLIRRAFQTAGVTSRIIRCKDGKTAMDYLEGKPPYTERKAWPLPQLMLLDLKLRQISGLDILRWVRSREAFRSQIVIILSSSAESHDVHAAYELNVNAFLVKPVSLSEMIELARCIKACWVDRFDDLFGPSLPFFQKEAPVLLASAA
jgi:DNA-binding response OmpR family regulator